MKIFSESKSKDKLDILIKAFEELHLEVELTDSRKHADFFIKTEEYLKNYGEGKHLITQATLKDRSGKKFIGNGTEIHLYKDTLEEIDKDKLLIEAIQNAYASFLIEEGSLGYREKSAAIVINNKKQLLLVQLQDYRDNDWNIPGGGIEEGETPEEALKRELKEELETDKFEVIEKSEIKNQYEWPNWLIAKDIVKKKPNIYRGQAVNQFIVKFTGNNSDIKIQEEEIKEYKWVEYDELEEHLNFEGQWENIKKVIENSSLDL